MVKINPFSDVKKLFAKLARDRSGLVLLIFGLLLPIIIGFAALGIESTLWFAAKRQLQNAADAGVVAGVFGLAAGKGITTNKTIATTEATRNGYDSSDAPTPLTFTAPTTGAFTASANARETKLSRDVPRLLSRVLFSAPVTISARAVAIYYKGGNACVLSLHEQDEGIVVTGSGRVIMDECIAASNSTDPIDSIVGAGSGYLETDCIYSVGGVSDVSRMQFDAGCVPVVGPPIVDPFAALEVPSPLPCNENNKTVGTSATETLGHPTAAEAAADVGGPIEAAYNARFSTPFVFCSGLVIRGDLTLNPGLYVITDNQLRVNSGATFTGSGVTIVLTTGADIDNFNGGASINLSAPLLDNEAAGNYTTAGDPATATPASDWRGMLFYQDRDSAICTGSNCNQVNGDSASKMTGAMYFPSQELTMEGTNQSGINCLQLVAYEISFSGNSDYVANGNPTNCNGIVKEIEVPDVIKLVE